MNQLVERVLTIGTRLAPIDWTCRIVDLSTFESYVFAIAFHGQLLQVRRKALEVLFVREHGDRLSPEKVGIPDAKQPQQHWQIVFEGCSAEVLVHLVEAVQHGLEILRTDGQHGRKADCRSEEHTSEL